MALHFRLLYLRSSRLYESRESIAPEREPRGAYRRNSHATHVVLTFSLTVANSATRMCVLLTDVSGAQELGKYHRTS